MRSVAARWARPSPRASHGWKHDACTKSPSSPNTPLTAGYCFKLSTSLLLTARTACPPRRCSQRVTRRSIRPRSSRCWSRCCCRWTSRSPECQWSCLTAGRQGGSRGTAPRTPGGEREGRKREGRGRGTEGSSNQTKMVMQFLCRVA